MDDKNFTGIPEENSQPLEAKQEADNPSDDFVIGKGFEIDGGENEDNQGKKKKGRHSAGKKFFLLIVCASSNLIW